MWKKVPGSGQPWKQYAEASAACASLLSDVSPYSIICFQCNCISGARFCGGPDLIWDCSRAGITKWQTAIYTQTELQSCPYRGRLLAAVCLSSQREVLQICTESRCPKCCRELESSCWLVGNQLLDNICWAPPTLCLNLQHYMRSII